MSTFNCPEEVFLAEKLIELHPWAENVKFARTGGEVNAMAVRIARAATGKNHVVICGYHGWHDWYLAANLSSSANLNDHLLPGLDPAGVPKELSGLTHAIRYNSFEDLELLDSNPDIGVLIMEVMRSIEPAVGYLEAIREKCNKNGIVLIFDECTSGFRETYGGLHLKFGITPDLATFGKALGNGFAITALIGKSTVMSSVEDTFMSSTFWSERTGYVAALASLKAMATLRSWEKITQIGLKMRNIWSESFIDTGIDFSFSGIPALSALQFHGPNGNAIKTLITQEMLKENILASNIFYPSIAHTEIHLEQYRSALQEVILKITKTSDPRKLLHSEPSQMGFKRLN
jgi:glutamate-1-semialdehyde 2,1-aminomutase